MKHSLLLTLLLTFAAVLNTTAQTIVTSGGLKYRILNFHACVVTRGATVDEPNYPSLPAHITIPAYIENSDGRFAVVGIDDSAFEYCTAIETVSFDPDCKPTAFGDFAFAGCPNLRDLTIPGTVTTLGRAAISTCPKLESIVVPSSVQHIDEYNFDGCTSLRSVTLSEGVVSLISCFYNCPNLKSLHIPASLTSLDPSQFNSTNRSLETLTIAPDNPAFTIDDGVIFNKQKTEILGFPSAYNRHRTHYTPPAFVTAIGDYAFMGTALTSITLNEGLASIGYMAFCSTHSLKSISLPASLTTLESNYVFAGSAVEHVHIGKGLATFNPRKVFDSARNIKTLTVDPQNPNFCAIGNTLYTKDPTTQGPHTLIYYNPFRLEPEFEVADGTKVLGESAFYRCNNLLTLRIPASVTTIEPGAFTTDGFHKITTIYNLAATPQPLLSGLGFSLNNLYVLNGCLNAYKNATGWSSTPNIIEMSAPCAKPTITCADGTLRFDCATPNATFRFSSSLVYPQSIDNNHGGSLSSPGSGNGTVMTIPTVLISVTASAPGYSPSATAFYLLSNLPGDANSDGTLSISDVSILVGKLLK